MACPAGNVESCDATSEQTVRSHTALLPGIVPNYDLTLTLAMTVTLLIAATNENDPESTADHQ